MTIIFSTLKKVLFWSYDRGTWQYDVMCVLILAFIFFTPNQWFKSRSLSQADQQASRPFYVDARDVGEVASGDVEAKVAEFLSRKHGSEVSIARINQCTDETGKPVYIVWTKE
jgi:hypothetical protein